MHEEDKYMEAVHDAIQDMQFSCICEECVREFGGGDDPLEFTPQGRDYLFP
jgi:hypothetical protein